MTTYAMSKMNTIKVALVSAAVFLLVSTGLNADAASDRVRTNVDRVMSESGIDEQIAQIPVLFDSAWGSIDDSDPGVRRILEILISYISAEDIAESVRANLSAAYDEASFKAFTDFYSSDLAKRLTKAEVDNGTPDGVEKAKNLDYSKVPEKRRTQLDHFYKSSNIPDMQFQIFTTAFGSFYKSLNFILPEENRISQQIIDATMEQVKAAIYSEEAKMESLRHYAVTYASFSDAELNRYFAFVDSKAGKWVNVSLMKGVTTSLAQSMSDATSQIVEEFGVESES